MSIGTIRKFFLISLALSALDGCVLGVALSSSAGSGVSGYSDVATASVNPGVLVVGLLLFLAAVVLETISWIGSLVRSGQLRQWGWFVCMLLPFVSGFAFLLYVIIGPTPITPMQPLNKGPMYQSPQQPSPYQQPYNQQPYGQSSYGQPPYGRPE